MLKLNLYDCEQYLKDLFYNCQLCYAGFSFFDDQKWTMNYVKEHTKL